MSTVVADPLFGSLLPDPRWASGADVPTPDPQDSWVYPYAVWPHFYARTAAPWCAAPPLTISS